MTYVHIYRTYRQSRTPGLLVDMSGYCESLYDERDAQRDMKEREIELCLDCGGTGFKNHNETTDCPECAAFGRVLVGFQSHRELIHEIVEQIETDTALLGEGQ